MNFIDMLKQHRASADELRIDKALDIILSLDARLAKMEKDIEDIKSSTQDVHKVALDTARQLRPSEDKIYLSIVYELTPRDIDKITRLIADLEDCARGKDS